MQGIFRRQSAGVFFRSFVGPVDRCWMHSLGWRASASRVFLHGSGTPTAGGIGIPTAVVLTRVNNHFPSIFMASPVRSTWLLAVQNGWPVAGFVDTSK